MNFKQLGYLPLLSLFAVTFAVAEASPLTPEQALQRAMEQEPATRTTTKDSYHLSYTESRNGCDLLYIFNHGNDGFIVASADDRLPALVGYSEAGSFEKKTASPAFLNWLGNQAADAESYFASEEKISAKNPISDGKLSSRSNSLSRAGFADIEPLITSQWSQGFPFNQMCPEVDDSELADRHCLTGCVATAMAQILNYHKARIPGKGSLSYQLTGRRFEGKLSGSFDYEGILFDYDNMLDSYYEDATDIEKDAVAYLMYACGVSVHAQYAVNDTGAYDFMIPYALRTYFGFSDRSRYLERSFFNTEEWEKLIYEELASNRPVIYNGYTRGNAGHAFVCDGYSDGLFHINWGWGGSCNGYFLLSILDPWMNSEEEGLGYRYDQSMVCGISPSREGISPWHGVFAYGGDLEVQGYEKNTSVTIGLDESEPGEGKGFFLNVDPDPLYGNFYLKAVAENGDIYYSAPTALALGGASSCCPYYEEQVVHDGKPFDNGFDFVTLSLPDDLPQGKYTCYLGFASDRVERQDVLIADGFCDFVVMTVAENGDITFGEEQSPEDSEKPESRIRINKIFFYKQEVHPVVRNKPMVFHFVIENLESEGPDYREYIMAKIFKSGTDEEIESAAQKIDMLVPAGIERMLPYKITLDLEPGDYDMIVYDENDLPISGIFTFTMIEEETPVTAISLSCYEFELEVGTSFTLIATIEPDDATFKRVDWRSSDINVARVIEYKREDGTREGEVWGLMPGEIEIIATSDNGLEAVCIVKVVEKQPEIVYASVIYFDEETNLRLSQPIYEGDEFRLGVKIEPEDTTDKSVDWSSSDESIATVDSEGNVRILQSGDVTIKATTRDGSNISASCTFYALAGISEILAESGKADVFTIDGRQLKKGADKEFLSTLEKGIYIVRTPTRSCIFIR